MPPPPIIFVVVVIVFVFVIFLRMFRNLIRQLHGIRHQNAKTAIPLKTSNEDQASFGLKRNCDSRHCLLRFQGTLRLFIMIMIPLA